MDVRPDSWFTKWGLSLDPRDRCEVQTYWVGQGFCPDVPIAAPSAIPTAGSTLYTCEGSIYDTSVWPTCESKIDYAMDVRPDSWFTKSVG